jgi:DNA-binding NarL/FixJ family response regulator
MAIDILLADDHPILRQGLKSLLQREGYAVVADCADGYEAVKLAEKLRPSIAVLDLSMPRLNGLDAAREIRNVSPRTKAILLTVHREDQYVLTALRAGVKGYVLKMEAESALVKAIQEAQAGNVYLSPGISRAVVDACQTGEVPDTDPLTSRELQILRLIAEGNTTQKVAEQLKITVKTAESYRSALMEKLDIHETATLVRYAVRRGLIKI